MTKKGLLIFALTAALNGYAETFTGKCVGVSDGDTVSVMKDGAAAKIRLNEIDCPESGQDFGSKAKQFTSGLVFGKAVRVEWKEKDRYGRLLGTRICGAKKRLRVPGGEGAGLALRQILQR